jgi:5-methylcytosine-specific restriction endonuclease McrA
MNRNSKKLFWATPKLKKCRYCLSKENLTIDHKQPLILKGTDDRKNLQVLCKRCNSIKSGIPDGVLKKIFKWHIQIMAERTIRKYAKQMYGKN